MFCVKTGVLMDTKSDIIVTSLKTNVYLHISLLSSYGNFQLKDIELIKNDILKLNEHNSIFNVHACTCSITSSNSYSCDDEPTIKENSLFQICIIPTQGLE